VKGFQIIRFRLPSELLRCQVFAWEWVRLLRRHLGEFNIIHANGFITWHATHGSTAHFVHSGRLDSRYFLYPWPQSPYGTYRRLFTLLNFICERNAFNRARAVGAVSRKIAEELNAIEVSTAALSAIHNGVDLEEFQPRVYERISLRFCAR
jgi:glycosyltransferase involved in cell wall biosynthesis